MPGRARLSILNEVEDRALDTCATCPSLCRSACPVAEAEARETTSPHRLVVMAGLLKRERIHPEQVDQTPFHCSSCRACTEVCLHDNDVPLLMSLARGRLLAAQAAPEAVRHVSGQFAVSGNAAGRSLEGALADAAAAANQSIVADAPEIYWPGCEVLSSDPRSAGDALRAVTLSGRPQPAVVRASASCCGVPLFWAGELDGFRSHAERFAAQFASVETLIAHDPACAHAVTHWYSMLGVSLRPQVVTMTEFLAQAWPAARARQAAPAYLDGCSQVRGLNELDAPRTLITKATGSPPIELAGPIQRFADCCGGQGLLPELVPGTAAQMAQARIDSFRTSGADRLVTASPRCRKHLHAVEPGLPVEDLTGWLAGH